MPGTIFAIRAVGEIIDGRQTGRTLLIVETDIEVDPTSQYYKPRDAQGVLQDAIDQTRETYPRIDEIRLVTHQPAVAIRRYG